MDACQAISGGGGLAPQCLPAARRPPVLLRGTYYPPERKYNRPSWTELLLHLAGLYYNDRASLEEQADNLVSNLRSGGDRLLSIAAEGAGLETMMEHLRGTYDGARGGFGGAPKFPQSQSLELLLAYGVASGNNNDVFKAGHGMRAMLDGGIYDQLGGGFSRYTVDANWRVPHFEKMLYDNGLLLRLLGKLQSVTPDDRYVQAIAETTEWLQSEMALPEGGYRAALDADSEGVEGKYYVWQYDELRRLLPPEDVDRVAAFYGITEEGNWEEEHTNIPYRPSAPAVDNIAQARRTLAEARRLRIPPGADDKLILQWNALLVSGWCACYRGTGEERYLTLAVNLYKSLSEQLSVENKQAESPIPSPLERARERTWYRNKTSGQLGAPAFLDDYAALAAAALDLSEVTFALDYALTDARALVDRVLATFSDPAETMFYLRPPAESELPVATKDFYDNALPSGNSQMAHNLYRLGRLTGEDVYTRRAERMIAVIAGATERYPGSFAGWGLTALLLQLPERELVVTGPGAVTAAREFLSDYRPGRLIVASETVRDDVPLLHARYSTQLRYFVCQNRSCQLPVDSAEAARQLLDPL